MERVVSGENLVLSPGGISPVFLGEVRARHRQRGRRVFGTINLADIRQDARKRFADACKLGTVYRELPSDFGYRRVRVDEPAVAEVRSTAHRAIVVGGEPDRRVGLLNRAAGHRDVGQLADFVLAADMVLGPQPLDDFETLLEATHAPATRHAK